MICRNFRSEKRTTKQKSEDSKHQDRDHDPDAHCQLVFSHGQSVDLSPALSILQLHEDSRQLPLKSYF